MSSAIPTMTSMYANPAAQIQYAQPTMTSMYATPGASMYMPATTVAAPQMVAAPTVVETVQAAPVAAPVVETVVAPAGPQFSMPAPVSLTQGLPTPAKLDAEKAAYAKALQAQLDKQSNAVMEEAKIKKKMLEQQARTQLEETKLQVEENLKMALLQVDQEAQTMLAGLKEAAITQGTAQEERAAIAIATYKKAQALETSQAKSYQLQKQWFESEAKLTAEYQKVMSAEAKLETDMKKGVFNTMTTPPGVVV